MIKYLSRKFVITILFGVFAFYLCLNGHLHGGEFVTAVSILSGFYKASNVVDKMHSKEG